MRAQNAIFGNSAVISESPKDADITTQTLAHGDLLVFASDGVWDNLSAMDTLSLLTPMMEKRGYWSDGRIVAEALRPSKDTEKEKTREVEQLPADLAYAVMRASKLAGMDQRRDGPFAREVQRYYPGEDWHGGKHDDVAVIVVLVVQDGIEGTLSAKL
jgi:protein phosphatase PTC7